ncbi:hypothetical protein Fmac_018104 [Flemingia macrophylla]|uniref:Pentatricopeptide repeat-containing protein n=1 Tax=Flemingia macrophylla TaxID=520843 RepID=A0ABD1M424_9FABA
MMLSDPYSYALILIQMFCINFVLDTLIKNAFIENETEAYNAFIEDKTSSTFKYAVLTGQDSVAAITQRSRLLVVYVSLLAVQLNEAMLHDLPWTGFPTWPTPPRFTRAMFHHSVPPHHQMSPCTLHHKGPIPKQSTFIHNNVISPKLSLGHLFNARKMFDALSHRTVVSYNTLITAYSRRVDVGDAWNLLFHMRGRDFSPT